jgi:hypothetical protein
MVFGGGPDNNKVVVVPFAGMVKTGIGCAVGVSLKTQDPSVLPISMQTPFPDFMQLETNAFVKLQTPTSSSRLLSTSSNSVFCPVLQKFPIQLNAVVSGDANELVHKLKTTHSDEETNLENKRIKVAVMRVPDLTISHN